jgi:2-oxo-3-hexenedioate decarboxylase
MTAEHAAEQTPSTRKDSRVAGRRIEPGDQIHGPTWSMLPGDAHLADGQIVMSNGRGPLHASPELAFALGRELDGSVESLRDVADAISYVQPVLVVTDSIGATLAYVLGHPNSAWRVLDLSLLGVLLEVNGQVTASATTATGWTHPFAAVVALARSVSRTGGSLAPGELVCTGELMPQALLQSGSTVEATFAHLGRVGLLVG